MLQCFIRFPEFAEFTEFLIHLGKTPLFENCDCEYVFQEYSEQEIYDKHHRWSQPQWYFKLRNLFIVKQGSLGSLAV